MNTFEIFENNKYTGHNVKAKDKKIAYKKARNMGFTGKTIKLKVTKKPRCIRGL